MRRLLRVNFLFQGTPTTITVADADMPPQTLKPKPDLKASVTKEYHNFLDVFEKPKPLVLPPGCYVDYAINLEPGAKSLFLPLFNTSEQVLQIICNYPENVLK